MSEKSLFASICNFFNGLFSSENTASPSPSSSSAVPPKKDNDGLTGVERYIRNQVSKSNHLTGVEKYIRNQVSTRVITGVEKYIRNQVSAQKITGVEAYIRGQR